MKMLSVYYSLYGHTCALARAAEITKKLRD